MPIFFIQFILLFTAYSSTHILSERYSLKLRMVHLHKWETSLYIFLGEIIISNNSFKIFFCCCLVKVLMWKTSKFVCHKNKLSSQTNKKKKHSKKMRKTEMMFKAWIICKLFFHDLLMYWLRIQPLFIDEFVIIQSHVIEVACYWHHCK